MGDEGEGESESESDVEGEGEGDSYSDVASCNKAIDGSKGAKRT